jgi:hypothetical protein
MSTLDGATPLEDFHRCQHELTTAVLRLVTTEHEIATSASAASRIAGLEDQMALAARNLVNRVDDLPPRLWPPGWALDGREDA